MRERTDRESSRLNIANILELAVREAGREQGGAT